MDKKLLEFLSKEAPNSLSDTIEVLELLSTTIDTAMDRIGENINKSFNNKDFEKIKDLLSYSDIKLSHLNALTKMPGGVVVDGLCQQLAIILYGS